MKGHIHEKQLRVLDHPVALDALARLRHPECKTTTFRETVRRLSRLLAVTATDNLPSYESEVLTPLGVHARGHLLHGKTVLIPVLRAGLGMVEGFLDIVPNATVGFLGLERDEKTLDPKEYYRKFPQTAEASIFVLDPMLATGGSACAALRSIKTTDQHYIALVSILSAPEGIEAVHSSFPDILIITAEVDERLDEHGFILPGLGDAGDRLWGTE